MSDISETKVQADWPAIYLLMLVLMAFAMFIGAARISTLSDLLENQVDFSAKMLEIQHNINVDSRHMMERFFFVEEFKYDTDLNKKERGITSAVIEDIYGKKGRAAFGVRLTKGIQ